ncbi:hypothetical protein [Bdellovibrio bacteriovorus]|uniref:hypothetical protein n=1 Tax=Bdellovibrio bacteriovorus TaxID=959 RepID=UPI0035A5CB31
MDASFFLRDLYNYRKKTEEGFSYETWAFELNFQHRSFLRQVVIGRRALTEATAQQIAHRLFTNPEEQRHFMILFHYSRSRTPQERQLFGQQLMQMCRGLASGPRWNKKIILGLSPLQFEELVKESECFLEGILSRLDHATVEGCRIFQFDLQLFSSDVTES